jgi:hypothetical protein
LVDAFVYREAIDQEMYESQLARLNEEIALVEMRKHDSELEALDVEGLLAYAEFLILNARRLWEEARVDQRQRLQRFFFPDGLTFAEGRVGTARTGLFFNELGDDSAPETTLATLTGFEPVIFTLKG